MSFTHPLINEKSNIFIDEGGDFGPLDFHHLYYINQNNNILKHRKAK